MPSPPSMAAVSNFVRMTRTAMVSIRIFCCGDNASAPPSVSASSWRIAFIRRATMPRPSSDLKDSACEFGPRRE